MSTTKRDNFLHLPIVKRFCGGTGKRLPYEKSHKEPLKEKHMKRRTAKSTIKSVFSVALLEKVWQLFTLRENITVVLLFVTSY